MFVERTLTARRGRKRAKLRLRMFAPVPHGRDAACSLELTAGRAVLWPADRPIHGIDNLQALLLAARMAVLQLELFERTTGLRIDNADWLDLMELRGDMPGTKETLARAREIRRWIRAEGEKLFGKPPRMPRRARRTPRAAAASRKPRAAAASRTRQR